jgi:vitamin B12 transporter
MQVRRLTSRLCQGFLPIAWMMSLPAAAHAQDGAADQPVGTAQEASPEPAPIIDVTVRGARLRPPSSPRDPTAASTVVSGESLQSPGASSADVLANVPGVQVSRSGSASDLATASIRGATSAQTPVYLAGILLNDDVAGTADLSTVPLWMLDRVEVYRGHAPGFADQLGIGGAVFFEPRLPRRTRIGVGQSVGSFGELSTWIAGEVRAEHASSLVALRRSSATNDYRFVDDGGTRFDTGDDVEVARENADFTAHDAWAVGRNQLGPGSDVTLIASAFDREQGVTGLAVIPARRARAHVRRFLGGLSARVPCARSEYGEADGPCTLSLSSAVVTAHTRIHDPLGELSLQSSELANDATRFTQRAGLRHRIGETNEVGIHATQATEHLAVQPLGGGGLRARRYTSRVGLTGTANVVPTVGLHAVAATECHTTLGPNSDSTCGVFEPSGRLGVRIQALRWLSLFANAGRYVRPPTLGELYGTSPIVRGNPDLTAEQGVSADAGIRVTRRGDLPSDLAGYLEAFAFTRWVSDLVAFQRSSFGVVRPFNVGTARIMGLELASGAIWLDHITNELSVTLLDPRDVTEDRVVANDILPFRSRLVVAEKLELFTEPAVEALRLDRLALGARVSHRSSRYADPAGLIVIDPHTTVDFELSGHFLDRAVAGRLALRNAFDESQYDTVGYPLPGRSYHASVEAWF